MQDFLGDRMKSYEDSFRFNLPKRMPVIIRLDGKAFHSYTKGCKKPYDDSLINCMANTTLALCEQIQGVAVAYTQSDEISLLLINYTELETQPWYKNNLQKITSVAASIASVNFTMQSNSIFGKIKPAYFDARAFVLPKEEVNNYFIWRQEDCRRNSLAAIAQSQFSQKELNGKKLKNMKDMLLNKGIDWDGFSTKYKNGLTVTKNILIKDNVIRNKWVVDNEIPLFSNKTDYINKYI